MAVKISSTEGKAKKNGINSGDTLIKINNHEINDLFDYRFYLTEKKVTLLIESEGEQKEITITKGEYDDIGLSFASYLMDEQKSCRNNCVFCFIDQNPKGMRETIYFKDDDDRMSFLFGNYITLTNIEDRDIERIIEMKITPINVSVHTTNPELRSKMMHNRFAGESLRHLRRLIEGGVEVNTQLVLCPEHNDGDELRKTLSDLKAHCPQISSICCVPVGLTAYREGLYPLRPFTKEESAEVIDIIEEFSFEMLTLHGDRIAYPSDEFFINAERPIPSADYYGEFKQLENGVGITALLRSDFHDELEYIEPNEKKRTYSIATGKLAYPFIKELVDAALKKDENLAVNIYEVPADFFGGYITVTGLICGSDIIKYLSDKPLGDALIIPDVMLRHEGDLFLDNVSVEELSQKLDCVVKPIPADGISLANTLMS